MGRQALTRRIQKPSLAAPQGLGISRSVYVPPHATMPSTGTKIQHPFLLPARCTGRPLIVLKQVIPPFPAAVAKQVAGLTCSRSVPLLGLEELGEVFVEGRRPSHYLCCYRDAVVLLTGRKRQPRRLVRPARRSGRCTVCVVCCRSR